MERRYQSVEFSNIKPTTDLGMLGPPNGLVIARRLIAAALIAVLLVVGWHFFVTMQATNSAMTEVPVNSSESARRMPNDVSERKGAFRLPRGLLAAKPELRDRFPAKSLIDILSMGYNRPMSREELLDLRSVLAELASSGADAIPAIRNFLESGDDVTFHQETGEAFEFSSLRIALMDVLRRIGGFEAESLLLDQLDGSFPVTELEAVADALEWLQPGLYTESILHLAREQLAQLSRPAAPEQRTEAGPLFRIFQKYGTGDSAAALFEAPYWLQDYAQVALASLPDSQGIGGLARKARRELRSSRHGRSLHLLVQTSVFDDQAEEALLTLVKSDSIPDPYWPLIGEILMGDRQLQLTDPSESPGNFGSLRGNNLFAVHTTVDRQVQVVYSVNYSAVLSPWQVQARIGLISRLADLTTNPAAIDALWKAFDALRGHYWTSSGS